MIHLVTFATDDMSISAEMCVKSAIAQGVTHCVQEGPITPSPEIAQRGCGFWKWKPRIIRDAMLNTFDPADGSQIPCRVAADAYSRIEVKDGDVLIYADAGVEFIDNVNYIIDRMDQDIFLFGNQWDHAHWCKRDIVEAIWPPLFVDKKLHELITGFEDPTWARFGKQAQASVIFFRVSDYTRKFVKEWLDWCLFEGGRLIDDSPSRAPNHPGFIENRHDQAILTTMAYRDGIKLHEWFVRYEGYTPGRMTGYPRELERPFVLHHRKRNADWMVAA